MNKPGFVSSVVLSVSALLSLPAAFAQQPPPAQPAPPPAPALECLKGNADCRVLNIETSAAVGGSFSRTRSPQTGHHQTAGTVAIDGQARYFSIPQKPGSFVVDARVDAQTNVDFLQGNSSSGAANQFSARGMIGIKGSSSAKDTQQATYYSGLVGEMRTSSSSILPQERALLGGFEVGAVGADYRQKMGMLLSTFLMAGNGKLSGQSEKYTVLDYGIRSSFVHGINSVDIELGKRKYFGATDLGVSHLAASGVWPLMPKRGISGTARISIETRKRIGTEIPDFKDLPDSRQGIAIGVSKTFGGSRSARPGK